MSKLKIFAALLRLGAVAALLALASADSAGASEEVPGSCSSNFDHGCAVTGESNGIYGKQCNQGTSGGCEDCVWGDPGDRCFYMIYADGMNGMITAVDTIAR